MTAVSECNDKRVIQLIHWNNLGADLTSRHRYAQATACFSKAITIARKHIRSTQSDSDHTEIHDFAEHICIAPADHPIQANGDKICPSHDNTGFPLHQKRDPETHAGILDSDAEPFLYRHPIRFVPTAGETFTLSSSLLQPLMVLVVVNMGIAIHHQALEAIKIGNKDAGATMMKRAVMLYEMALKEKSQRMCLQPLGKIGFQILLASYNNLSHALGFLNLRKRAQVCFRALLSLLMWAVVNDLVSITPMDGYWESVYHLLIAPAVSAAAA